MSEGLMAYFGYGSLVNLKTLKTPYRSAHPASLQDWRRHWQSRKGASPDGGGTQHQASVRTGSEQRLWQTALKAANADPDIGIEDIALLSVHREPDFEIDGMLIVDELASLPELDERERLYDRTVLDRLSIRLLETSSLPVEPDAENLFVYVGQSQPDNDSYLLQSYLDAVLSGFEATHGEGGIDRFLASTAGFDRGIICDRAHPIYPRAVTISPKDADRYDQLLLEAGVIFC